MNVFILTKITIKKILPSWIVSIKQDVMCYFFNFGEYVD
jgi:hypothetical protein